MCDCVCCRYNIENVSEYYSIKAKKSYWKDKNGIKHMALKLNLNKKGYIDKMKLYINYRSNIRYRSHQSIFSTSSIAKHLKCKYNTKR